MLCKLFVRRTRLGVTQRIYSSFSNGRFFRRLHTVNIPSVGSSGDITLDIHTPTDDNSSPVSRHHDRIILFLARGPFPSSSTTDHETSSNTSALSPSELSRTGDATVVQVNYRLSPSHVYPTPVFDVLAAYDWVVHNLVPERYTQHDGRFADIDHDRYTRDDGGVTTSQTQQPRLGVYGEKIGGGLALMLAMTECKMDDNARIGAVAVREPVVDWTFAPLIGSAETSTAKRRSERSAKRNNAVMTTTEQVHTTPKDGTIATATPGVLLSDLLVMRNKLFPANNLDAYFSPFASPIHFLRTPSIPVPTRVRPLPLASPSLSPAIADVDTDEQFDLLAELDSETIPREKPVKDTSPKLADSGESESSMGQNHATLPAIDKDSTSQQSVIGVSTEEASTKISQESHPPKDFYGGPKRHRIPLRYPPTGTGFSLMPDSLFSVSPTDAKPDSSSPPLTSPSSTNAVDHEDIASSNTAAAPLIRDQSEEMVKLLRRAWIKWGTGADLAASLSSESFSTDDESDNTLTRNEEDTQELLHKNSKINSLILAAAERKISLDTEDQSAEARAIKIGTWFTSVLGRPDEEAVQAGLRRRTNREQERARTRASESARRSARRG